MYLLQYPKKLFVLALSLSLFISFFNSLPAQASAKELKINKRNFDEVSKVLENLKDKDPQKVVSQNLKTSKNKDELVSEQGENLHIRFNLKNKKVELSDSEKGNISLEIPNKNLFDSVDIMIIS